MSRRSDLAREAEFERRRPERAREPLPIRLAHPAPAERTWAPPRPWVRAQARALCRRLGLEVGAPS